MTRLSKFLQEQRTRQILPYLAGSILDVGCGYNPLIRYLKPESRYIGVEREEVIIHWLKNKFPGVPFFQCDLNKEELPIYENFDRIILMAVIEHLDDPQTVLARMRPRLCPGGKLIMTTPSPIGDQIHQYGAKLNLFSQIAADEHNIILTQTRVKAMLENAGFKLVLYKTFLMGGNQLIIAAPG